MAKKMPITTIRDGKFVPKQLANGFVVLEFEPDEETHNRIVLLNGIGIVTQPEPMVLN